MAELETIQRVRRTLSRDHVEKLRIELAELVPQAKADIPRLIKMMRLITRLSQAEYAKLCKVAPRVLADIESGRRNVRLETLEKLIRPFKLKIGVVVDAEAQVRRR